MLSTFIGVYYHFINPSSSKSHKNKKNFINYINLKISKR